MKTYNQFNKKKNEFESLIKEKDEQISGLKEKLVECKESNDSLRKKLHEAGQGFGEVNKLKKRINELEREVQTLKNKVNDSDVNALVSSFIHERQVLIRKIKDLHFDYKHFNYLATKFIDGLNNVIKIASKIKTNKVDDMDYYTFVFRDDIVGLLEKMLRVVLDKKEGSATKYFVKLKDGDYTFPKDYYQRIPNLKDKKMLNNVLELLNLESRGYHGSKPKEKTLKENPETQKKEHPDRFLNLSNEDQLNAIFLLLEFMYDVFTNKDRETNLLMISSNWIKTI